MLERGAASARSERLAQRPHVSARSYARPYSAAALREVEPGGRGDVLGVERPRPAPSACARPAGSRRCRRRRCRAARSSASGRAARRRAARRCRGRARRRRSTATTGPVAAAAAPKALDTVPSMPFAPRLQSTRGGSVARGPERLDIAHRHRGGDEQRRLAGQQHAELDGHARALRDRRRAHRGSPPRSARRRCASCRATPPRPRGDAAAVLCSAVAGSSARECESTAAGSCQAPSGSSDTCGTSVRPASHVRSGLDIGRSPTRSTRSGRGRGG